MLQHPEIHHIPYLKTLWREVFGDPEEFIENFFRLSFAPDRCLCVTEKGIPVAAAYWLPGTVEGCPAAYLYAIATDPHHRRRGHFHALMEAIPGILKNTGYDLALLVPAREELFSLYASLGYAPCCPVEVLKYKAGKTPAPLTLCAVEDYQVFRASLAPQGEFLPGEEVWRLLENDVFFARGENFCFYGILEDGTLKAPEFLGDREAIPGILRSLGADRGICKTFGKTACSAMYLPLKEGLEEPKYLGFPLE